MKTRLIIWTILLGLVLVAGACTPKGPDSPAEFYANKTVTLVVPYPPGGGTDYGARLFANYWSQATKGGTMIIDNKPGGGGLEGPNIVWAAKPDGLTLGTHVRATTFFNWFFKSPGVSYTYEKFHFMGYYLHEPYVFAVGKGSRYSGKSMQDLQQADGLIFGAGGVNEQRVVGEVIVAELFKLKGVRIVPGFTGTAGLGVGAGRGEMDAAANNATSVREQVPQFFNPPLVTLDRKRTAVWPDTPTIYEMLKLSPQEKELADFFSDVKLGKDVFAPPGVPADKIKYLRETFDRIMNIPGFVQQAKERFIAWEGVTSGEIAAREVNAIMGTSEQQRTRIIDLVSKYTKK